jgi:CRP-like cAMP-binding protein
VTVRGKPRPSLGPGDCFGEIALLRDIPRTATIIAAEPLHTLALRRDEFLAAIASSSRSGVAAESLVAERLSQDPSGDH